MPQTKESRKMNNENKTLKPCPFCGSNCVNDTSPPEPECGSYYWVCPDCVCCGGIGDTVEEATQAWNTRPLEDALKAKADMFDELVGSNGALTAIANVMKLSEIPEHAKLIGLNDIDCLERVYTNMRNAAQNALDKAKELTE
tara:strand:- start:397 stop:822 length:426 start_codon:yes stop_codon:yes gene_type:complete